MAIVHVIGDANDGGGIVTTTPQSKVRDQGRLLSVDGALGSGHPPCPLVPIHCAGNWVTANGASWFRIQGIPVNHDGNADTCGHVRVAGSSKINIHPR
ncbi:hypothetical protein L1787_16520 [Acuticoccus sp. M5D2P5]|uniref:hypothetical protein n=1 Tax=Acuticoccus kalidii TaxID=2910977 RepID=UPI001F185744|nr:hypothetical protein [Acuticoccus kalidii]MCF3935010.1 hypothetical protein [Acuticoccus kalidii]